MRNHVSPVKPNLYPGEQVVGFQSVKAHWPYEILNFAELIY